MTVPPTNQTPAPAPKANKKVVVWVIVVVAIPLLLLALLVTTLVSKGLSGHNWDLGFAQQQSADELAKVKSSINATENDAIIDVVVKNANTSGTPFGHSVRVNVLVDSEKLNVKDDIEVEALINQVTNAIKTSGVSDTFFVSIGLNINAMAVSGQGTPENPVTSAERMSGAYDLYSETIEVK